MKTKQHQPLRLTPLLPALLLTLFLAGCVPSINPLYTEKDLVFEKSLLGVWGDPNSPDETWTFRQDGANRYTLALTEKDHLPGVFHAHLVKLENHLFLDLFPEETAMKEMAQIDFYKFHYVPTHTFMKVHQLGPTLKLGMLDHDWLKKELKENPKAIDHVLAGKDNDLLVLTASTADLQRFVIKHADTDKAWDDGSELKKLAD